ncbi:SusC/RagA family TonB-linked outer membrane protein [Chitinophaga japonensis]|uniref:SusC/RagA family TonB-linked outer membrane protein n=1 Tax=Chitinophaga japonensis TaxID=104662 RepID=UPI001B85E76D|nr:TonB-dependent receptor [Chitinophaga japonensis]
MPLRTCMAAVWCAALLFLLPFYAWSQTSGPVGGRVTDENGQPVPGATIVIKGTSTGTVTNEDGIFKLNAPGNGVLLISSVGFTSREISINNRSNIPVTLGMGSKGLEEVVVVGYGTSKRRDVTGAIASVSSETLKEVPAPNLISQLKGRTAGVSIVSNGATPGVGGQIRIRGNRTITNSQGNSDALDGPLLVLDGIPYGGSINDLNPDDIANLEILKDASATAIYGSRGAGGVILITTKRGKPGRPVISYDSYYGISSVMGKYKVMNGQEYAQFKEDAAAYNRSNWPGSGGTSSYLLTQAEKDALAAGISTDWQDLIYQNGFTTSHQLSLSGGTETTQYGMGGGYYREGGIIPNQKFERYNLRATIDHRIGKRLRIGLNTINTLSYSNTPGGGGVPGTLVRLTPLAAPYLPDGSVNLTPAAGSIDAAIISPLTLMTKKDAILDRTRRLRTFNSLYGELQITDGLRYRVNVGLDYRQENANAYNGPLTFTNTATTQASSNARVNNGEAWAYNIQNLLYYEKTFAQKHRLDVTALFEVNKDHSQSSTFEVTGVPADYIKNANFALASGQPRGEGTFVETGLLSYMGRINYAYDNRYVVTATVRVDGSSTLAPGHQYFTYPAFGLGWNISEEAFMRNVSFISNLKLRGGWGISGNRNVPAYQTLAALSASTYNFGQGTQGQQLAYLVTQVRNPSLTWQSTSQYDVGLDFGLFNNRITGTVDVYEQRTKDILLPVSLPQSNGADATVQNLGKTRGRGLEIMVSSTNINTRSGFTWSTDVNFFFNREEITELTTPAEVANKANGWFVGQPLSVIYDYKKIGIWQLEDSAKGLTGAQTSPRAYPGQIRVEDVDGNGVIDANDRQIIGNFQPQWEGGLTNRFSYKGFDLSVVIYARMGMKVLAPYLSADGGANGFPFFNQGRVNQLKLDYWTRDNPTNAFPAPDAGTDRLNFGSTLAYQDGSFIKCRSINLGYSLPEGVLKKLHVSSLRFYANITNPFIIYSPFVSDGLGPDPEGNGYGGAVNPTGSSEVSAPTRQVSVNLNNPTIRQYTFGANLKF